MNSQINRDPYKLTPGKTVMIHAYKFNGWLYRCWDFPKVIADNEKYTIVDLTNIKIISAEKNSMRSFVNWSNKQAFWVFMKKKWFNFRISKSNVGYKIYINLATPFIYEESAIKYYDLDLDFKYYSNGVWSEVDIKDLDENSRKFNYPAKLIDIIHDVEKEIWELINKGFFNKFIEPSYLEAINDLMNKYKEVNHKVDSDIENEQ